MVLVHGMYRWAARRLAFRNDYCRACQDRAIAVCVSTFNVLHIYWLPLLPLGRWSRWLCARCGNKPHAAARTRRGFKIVLAVLAGLLNVVAWFAPLDIGSELQLGILRAVALVLLLLALRWVATHRPEPDLKALLAAVLPYTSWDCPLCGGRLVETPTAVQCGSCKAERKALRDGGGSAAPRGVM
jgi:hypothetical protein